MLKSEYQENPTMIPNQILQSSNNCATMDLEQARQIYEDMMTKKQIQAIHNYSITEPKNAKSRWMTRIKKGGKVIKVVAPTERELYKKLNEFYFEQGRTLETLYPEWLERRSISNVDVRTIARNKNHWNKYYEGHTLVQKPILEITVFDLENFFHEQIRRHFMTVKELNNMKLIAKDMLHMSKRNGYIKQNPYHDMELNKDSCKPANKGNDTSRIYLPEEQERFFKALNEEMKLLPDNTDCHAILLLFKFALRIGELCALQFNDIDTFAKELCIRRMETIGDVDGKMKPIVVPYTKKKSEYGFRELPLTAYEMDIFETVRQVNEAYGHNDNDFIFCDEEGRTKIREIDHRIRKLCKKAEIVPAKSAHDIRRTVATQMNESGVPIEEIQKFLGHSEESTTRSYIIDGSVPKWTC